ncbi:hypothetical protein AC1031_008998 [Aphanomyces cochlioides]|nr:hypothetical protein AC1031_008998 [Aphanomyces cochlioides]
MSSYASFFAKIASIRHEIHENPELGFQEFKTQALVEEFLVNEAQIPRENIKHCATTGLVVDIHGPAEGEKTARLTCIAFRGDMDALPMTEHNPHLEYQSKVVKAAHMCGHDGHTASLMGFAALLSKRRHLLPPHTIVRLLFQPAEEGRFGAPAMIKDGCLESVEEVYGYHNAPFPLGVVATKAGPLLAHASRFKIVISGPGGHGSAPHVTKDPIVAAGQIILAVQSIASRSISPHEGAVISITQVHGGEADNVIPSQVTLSGTTRDFSVDVQAIIRERMTTIVHSTCAAYGVTGTVNFVDGYPVVVNDATAANIVLQVAEQVVGKANVTSDGLPKMYSEDFSYYLHERSGCFFLIGTASESETQNRECHSDTYDFNDAILPIAARMFLEIVNNRFSCAVYAPEELAQMTQARA